MSAREVRYYQDGYATLLKEVNIPEVDPDGTASGTGTGTGTGSGTGTGTGTGTGVLTLDADRTTDYVSQVKFMYSGGSMAMHYDYDRNGSIIQADEGTKKVRYKYDALGRLIREDNQPLDKTYIYEYSINGNITKVREYAYTVSETPSGGTTVNYTYSSNPSRTDRLTAVGGAGVTGYDAAGNPSGYKGASLSWFRGRMLQGYQKGGTAVSYTYDMNGIRRSKTVNGVQHTYFVDGTRIYSEKAGSQVYTYLYDASGITGIRTGGDYYYFLKTQQGDVKYIVSSSGVPQCEYVYDAWGNHRILSAAGEDITDNAQYANSISHINPFRYRGYYYDTETGFYYLNSRYYDPQVRRFINADDPSVPSGEQSTVFGGLNLYAYCLNNPVMGYDPYGTFDLLGFIKGVGRIVTGIAAVAVGVAVCVAGASVAILAVAAVTIIAGVLTVVNGAADIQQSVTGNNFVRDTVFNGNQTAYDFYSGVTERVAIAGTVYCGNYLGTYCNMNGAVSGTEGKVTFEPGTTLDRYGSQYGRYLTDPGTSINKLALPPNNSCKLTTYVVNRPITFRTGVVAECKWGPGGGIQYFSWMSVKRLVQFGFLTPLG